MNSTLPNQTTSIGVDIVQVSRFDRWSHYTAQQLSRVFSLTEIEASLMTGAITIKNDLIPQDKDQEDDEISEYEHLITQHTYHETLTKSVMGLQNKNSKLRVTPRLTVKLYQSKKLATRFAAKEAFFKAWCALVGPLSKQPTAPPFLSVCKIVSVTASAWGAPEFCVDWQALAALSGICLTDTMVFKAQLSLAHEDEYAIATALCTLIQH